MKRVSPASIVCAATLLGGLALAIVCGGSLSKEGYLDFEPNIAGLKGSPYGKTLGLALQGPVVSFWDQGLGYSDQDFRDIELTDSSLDGFTVKILDLKERKTSVAPGVERNRDYQNFVYSELEDKLKFAWEMDPTNFANYAIYQMLLYETFDQRKESEPYKTVQVSQKTIEAAWRDDTNPASLLTVGQAAFDLALTAVTFPERSKITPDEVQKWSENLPLSLEAYEQIVSEMKANGRWDLLSDIKKDELDIRFRRLSQLNQHRGRILQRFTSLEGDKRKLNS